MKKAGITISKMAAMVGTSRGHIYTLEGYTGHPPKIDLMDVADYASITKTPISWLLLGVDPQHTNLITGLRLDELSEVIARAVAATKSEIKKASQDSTPQPPEK